MPKLKPAVAQRDITRVKMIITRLRDQLYLTLKESHLALFDEALQILGDDDARETRLKPSKRGKVKP